MGKDKIAKQVEVRMVNVSPKTVNWEVVKYVICSDGLSDLVSNEVIYELLEHDSGARQYVQAALQAGGKDNVTVVTMEVISM